MRRRQRGLTLAELTVAVALFALFATTALAALNLALRHWSRVARKVEAAQSAREVAITISAELRQGLPNPSSIGYLSLRPAVSAPTAVMLPNESTVESSELIFFEPHPTRYDPSGSGFSTTDTRFYRQVRYYVSGGSEVRREVTTYGSGGTITSTDDALVGSCEQVVLRFVYRAADLFDVQVTGIEAPGTSAQEMASLTARVHVLGK